MGMSASQARLLSITARISDIEYKSQQISNVKIRLADESQQVANAYTQALNKQKYTLTTYPNGTAEKIDLTVSQLMKSDSKYRLVSSKGKTLVSSDVKQNYMRCMSDWNDLLTCGNSTRLKQQNETQDDFLKRSKESGYWESCETQEQFLARYQAEKNWKQSVINDPEARKSNCKASFVLQQVWGQGSFRECKRSLGLDPNTQGGYDVLIANSNHTMDEVKHYEDLFEQLYAATTQTSVYVPGQEEPFGDGTFRYAHEDRQVNSDALLSLDKSCYNDPNWLYEALESGEFMIINVETGKEVSVSSESSIHLESDTTGMAKAEAEYNAATAKINKKEKKLDMELKALDTEHNALSTEFDSVKTLIGDNVEKSFNLFS